MPVVVQEKVPEQAVVVAKLAGLAVALWWVLAVLVSGLLTAPEAMAIVPPQVQAVQVDLHWHLDSTHGEDPAKKMCSQ